MRNFVQLIGSLGRDPEVRTMQSGGEVVTLSLATNERWTDRDGRRQDRTDWHRVVIFNDKIGARATKYLRKGSKCLVTGKLQTRKWQDKNGTDHFTTEIVIQNFGGDLELLDGRQAEIVDKPAIGGAAAGDDLDDDVPF